MNLKFLKSFLILLILPFLCSAGSKGAGYKGSLPDLNKALEPEQSQNTVKYPDAKDILPLDLNEVQVLNKKLMTQNNKYAQYNSDVEEIVQLVKKLKDNIKTKKSVQDYNAVASIINLYVKSFEQKYANKKESRFKSYKVLIDLNYNIQIMGNYWIDSNSKIQYVSNYKTAGFYSGSSVDKNLKKLLQIIENTLVVLKKSSL
jgi:hypothetical protein